VVIEAGDQLDLGAVGQEHPAHDVELPQLHRLFAFPPDIGGRRAAALARGDQAVADQHFVQGGLRRHRGYIPLAELERQPGRSPPGMGAAHLAHRGLDRRGDLVRARSRPVRAVGQGGQAASFVTAHPGVTLCRDTP
jgi:hypothetical protein